MEKKVAYIHKMPQEDTTEVLAQFGIHFEEMLKTQDEAKENLSDPNQGPTEDYHKKAKVYKVTLLIEEVLD